MPSGISFYFIFIFLVSNLNALKSCTELNSNYAFIYFLFLKSSFPSPEFIIATVKGLLICAILLN